MTPRERVLCALKLGQPDRVPFCELGVAQDVARRILNKEKEVSESEISAAIHRDNITSWHIGPPRYAKINKAKDGREYVVDGLIKSKDDLKMVKLTDPNDDEVYRPAVEFLKSKDDFAACVVLNLGSDPVIQGMGLETFSTALYDNPALVETLLDIYTDWYAVAARKLCNLGFDFIWAADDIAYKTGTIFSPKIYREMILPKIRKVACEITIPWIYHSDGNLMPVIEELLSLGMNGIHPLEPGAMDINEFKKRFGHRVCVVGNVDINTLTTGTEEDVEAEVREKIRELADGGGCMISSSNTLTSYCKPENVIAMSKSIQKYGVYPIKC